MLTTAQFTDLRNRNCLKIALIGMSNIGKTHWAKNIATRYGFTHCEIDTQIQTLLKQADMNACAHWLGLPTTAHYQERECIYLRHEETATRAALSHAGNFIIDTTGSVVHLSSELRHDIKNQTLIVYLQANAQDMQILRERFESVPKPLIWAEHTPAFSKTTAHIPMPQLMTYYTQLMEARAKLYQEMAHITFKTAYLETQLKRKNANFLAFILQAL